MRTVVLLLVPALFLSAGTDKDIQKAHKAEAKANQQMAKQSAKDRKALEKQRRKQAKELEKAAHRR